MTNTTLYQCVEEAIRNHNISFDETGSAEMLDEGELQAICHVAHGIYIKSNAICRGDVITDKNGNPLQPDAHGWYPIECAPKDGTVVIICSEQNFTHREAFFEPETIGHDGQQGCWIDAESSLVLDKITPITHFRPCLNPPVTENES